MPVELSEDKVPKPLSAIPNLASAAPKVTIIVPSPFTMTSKNLSQQRYSIVTFKSLKRCTIYVHFPERYYVENLVELFIMILFF